MRIDMYIYDFVCLHVCMFKFHTQRESKEIRQPAKMPRIAAFLDMYVKATLVICSESTSMNPAVVAMQSPKLSLE